MSGEPRSPAELHRRLLASRESAFRRYQDLFVGGRGAGRLLLYEAASWASGLPGAPGFALRRLLFRPLLGRMGKGVVFGRHVVLRHPGKIFLGDHVILDDHVVLDAKGGGEGITIEENALISRNTILSCKEGSIRVGRGTKLGINCLVHAEGPVEIGPDVLLAAYCYLMGGGTHEIDGDKLAIVAQPSVLKGGIVVGEGAWLAARVTVLDGVRVGRGAVVGAGAVVRDDVPERAVAAGVPARVLRMRGAKSGGDDD